MVIKSVKNLKFKDNKGVYTVIGKTLALYEDGKGYISLDGGLHPYCPIGGRNALKSIIEQGGFIGDVSYINPIA